MGGDLNGFHRRQVSYPRDGVTTDIHGDAAPRRIVHANVLRICDGYLELSMNAEDLTQTLRVIDLSGTFKDGVISIVKRIHQYQACRCREGRHLLRLKSIAGEGFFAQDMLASAEGLERPFMMLSDRQCNIDCVNTWVID